jgi:deoxycytidylate deaminase
MIDDTGPGASAVCEGDHLNGHALATSDAAPPEEVEAHTELAYSGAVRLFSGTTIDRPEIVVGLVGALGTDLQRIETALISALFSVGYRSQVVRVSDLIAEEEPRLPGARKIPKTAVDRRMDQGDALRRAVSHGAAAAALAVVRVAAHRREAAVNNPGVDEGEPAPERQSHVTIIRSLKHPEEVRLLRSVYGPRFVLVGAWAPTDERRKDVGDRLRSEHPGETEGWYDDNIRRLLLRDEKDSEQRLGQRVRDTFELADAYVALLPGRDVAQQAQRLVRLLFGAPFETPTWLEQAMFQADGARLRSADAGRQVGAVVVDSKGELLLTGVNEVPKPGGGQYWTDSVPDHRDFRYGYDENERQKLELVVDVLQRLQIATGWLAPEKQAADVARLAREAVRGPLAKSRISDLLEFGRVAHAEMAAICTAARRGTALGGSTMLTTTYPCHECARLIIASGIKRVVYVDPYPKSQVRAMYRHEIADGPSACGDTVVFEPFEGVAPRLYRAVFAMPDRTRDEVTGDYAEWDPAAAAPRLVAEAEANHPVHYLEDGVVREMVGALRAAGWQPVTR